MRNRAKCRLCGDVIESFHRGDYVACSCDEIAVAGGPEKLEVFAKAWSSFLRVDDEDNEIVITVDELKNDGSTPIPAIATRDDYIKILEDFCTRIDTLPMDAAHSAITHADMVSILRILLDIFKSP